jgi:hypothetical protein
MRFIFWFFGIFVSVVFAFIPEIAMYFIYNLIAPQSDLTRILLLVAFWFGGIGLCVLFGALGVLLAMAVTTAAFE